MFSSWCVGALARGGGGASGFSAWVRASLGGGEDLGLRGSSLDGGLGLTPFTYVVVGRVTVENTVFVDCGEQTLVSGKVSITYNKVVRKRNSKSNDDAQ